MIHEISVNYYPGSVHLLELLLKVSNRRYDNLFLGFFKVISLLRTQFRVMLST